MYRQISHLKILRSVLRVHFMCSVWVTEHTAIIHQYSISCLYWRPTWTEFTAR